MAIRLSGLASGLDTDSMVTELVSAYSLKKENYEKQKTKLEWKQDIWKSMNTSIYSFYTGSLSSMRRLTSFTNKKNCTVSDTTKATVTANSKVSNGTQNVAIQSLAKAAYLTGASVTQSDGTSITSSTKLSEMGVSTGSINVSIGAAGKEETKTFLLNTDETISDFTTRFKEETGVTASFDTDQGRFIFTNDSGASNNFSFTASSSDDLSTLSSMGLATADQYTAQGETVPTNYAYQQAGSDATMVINGATYTSSSNTITVNGLSITALGVTDGITVTTSQDTDGIYDMVKNFLSDYNTLINDITAKYNASTAKGYEPLTDDEKDSMSDTEIEKWETKIKDSLLRRDDTLDGLMSAMTSKMSAGFEIDGKTYYLSSFGINTLGYLNASENEQNAYHIDGDSDDSSSADNTDKLKAMIESDPDTVANFFNQLTSGLYSSLTTKMASSTLSSAYTVYNDKDMKSQISDLKDTIDDWNDKITDYEDYWYSKFSAMETSLAQLQSETSSLTSLLGS